MDMVFTDFMHNFIGLYAGIFAYVIFLYGFQICLMLAVGFDCKAKGIKRQAMWMILTLLFPAIAAIIYVCVRNSETKENYKKCNSCGATLVEKVDYCAGCGCHDFTPCEVEKKQKYSKNSTICLIVSIVSFVIALVSMVGFMFNTISMVDDTFDGIIGSMENSFSDFDDDYEDYSMHYGYKVDGKTVYYDREGKSYTDDYGVVYYDKQNNTYTFDEDQWDFVDSDGKIYNSLYAYIDENGYFYFDEAGYENDVNSTVYYSAKYDANIDKDGNRYFCALDVSWDKDGNMIDCYGDNLLD